MGPVGQDLAGATFRKVMPPVLRRRGVRPVLGQQLLAASSLEGGTPKGEEY